MRPTTGIVIAAKAKVITVKLESGLIITTNKAFFKVGKLVDICYDYTTNRVIDIKPKVGKFVEIAEMEEPKPQEYSSDEFTGFGLLRPLGGLCSSSDPNPGLIEPEDRNSYDDPK